MKNRKAFTLAEVLAVIVIVGILSTIGIVATISVRKNQENQFNQTQEQLFLETGKSYFSDHKSELPTLSDSTSRVYLQELIKENYIDSLLDYNKNIYLIDQSYFEVKKVDSEYLYSAKLIKQSQENSDSLKSDSNETGIDFSN